MHNVQAFSSRVFNPQHQNPMGKLSDGLSSFQIFVFQLSDPSKCVGLSQELLSSTPYLDQIKINLLVYHLDQTSDFFLSSQSSEWISFDFMDQTDLMFHEVINIDKPLLLHVLNSHALQNTKNSQRVGVYKKITWFKGSLHRGISGGNTKVLVKPVKKFNHVGVYTSNVVYQEVLRDE